MRDGKYEGWRIWDISEDRQTIILISGGCPEVYFHEMFQNSAYNTEMILTGETTGTINSSYLFTPRAWNDYLNEEQYANSARAMKKSDLDTWYGKYVDSSITDTRNISAFPLITENKLISMVDIGAYYWTPFALSHVGMAYVDITSRRIEQHNGSGYAFGVRILVSLAPEVKFSEKPEKIEKDGFLYNKWSIEVK